MTKALTIEAGTDGSIQVLVHRDAARDYSAERGLDLLRLLMPTITEMDRLTGTWTHPVR